MSWKHLYPLFELDKVDIGVGDELQTVLTPAKAPQWHTLRRDAVGTLLIAAV